MSTSLNAIAATVYEDYIKSRNLSDAMSGLIMKSIVVCIGCIAVVMVFVIEKMGNLITVRFK
jgi:type III secretory pathway component EscT